MESKELRNLRQKMKNYRTSGVGDIAKLQRKFLDLYKIEHADKLKSTQDKLKGK